MSGEFVAEYVQTCVNNGIQSPADIRKCAENEIQQLNEQIQKIEELRQRQAYLRAVVRHMGGGTKINNTSAKTMDFSIPWADLDNSFKELCLSVCKIVKDTTNTVLPTDIMHIISDTRDHKAVYSAIKWLHQNNILGRLSDGGLKKGESWHLFLNGFNSNK